MTYANLEFTDAARDKFGFLVDIYGFKALVKEARGTYLSQIVFESNYLQVEVGVWGQGNEFWITFKPLLLENAPEFDIHDVLNGITNDINYFEEQIGKKVAWPVFTHTFPAYFERCADELKSRCEKTLKGDLSQWVYITSNVLNHRIARQLRLHALTGVIELTDKDKQDLDPLVTFIKSTDPDFSFEKIQYIVLDSLTR